MCEFPKRVGLKNKNYAHCRKEKEVKLVNAGVVSAPCHVGHDTIMCTGQRHVTKCGTSVKLLNYQKRKTQQHPSAEDLQSQTINLLSQRIEIHTTPRYTTCVMRANYP